MVVCQSIFFRSYSVQNSLPEPKWETARRGVNSLAQRYRWGLLAWFRRKSPIFIPWRVPPVEPPLHRPRNSLGRVAATAQPLAMKNCFLFLLLLVAAAALAQQSGSQVEKPFPAGGHIRMSLEAGDYTIRPAAGNVIRVSWTPTSYEGKESVRAAVEISGSEATVRVSDTPHNNFHAVIEIPGTSDLYIRLTAGDLNVANITGNKDIESRAGDMNIDIADPNAYGKVDAGVVAGDLNASAFSTSKGGLFRSFQWHGPGSYRLHVHLWAGDLNLRRSGPRTSLVR